MTKNEPEKLELNVQGLVRQHEKYGSFSLA